MSVLTQDAALLSKNVSFPRVRSGSLFVSFLICALVVLWFVQTSEDFAHWFVLPVLFCGTLIGADAIDWFRGRFGLIDPAGFLGLLGFHFFFLAPLLHVHWDQWIGYIVPPTDWRPWLGGMALLNGLGLLIYRFSRGPQNVLKSLAPRSMVWRVAPRKFFPIICCALLTTALLQFWVYQEYGGIVGYISTFEEATIGGSAFKGMGIVFTFSESFPIVAMIGFALYAGRHKMARSWMVISLALSIYFILLMLFGGLRGGRGNTIFQLFWGAGIIHLWVRPLSKKMMMVGLIFLIGFMYVYGFYKEGGLKGLTAIEDAASREDMQRKTGRTMKGAILGDLGRSDVQAFLLYRLWPTPIDYEYAWGRTYLGALALLVPRNVWADRPSTKVKEGTELMFGRGSHEEEFESPFVYGLAGEAMLNYGMVGVPPAFFLLGIAVRSLRRLLVTLDRRDIRLLVIPFLVVLTANMMTGDSDNLVFNIIKFGTVPFLVLASGSIRSSITSYNTCSSALR